MPPKLTVAVRSSTGTPLPVRRIRTFFPNLASYVVGAPPYDCQERHQHRRYDCEYIANCSDEANDCEGPDPCHHIADNGNRVNAGIRRQVCPRCEANPQNTSWYNQFRGLLQKPPPPNESLKWPGYWTRLCSTCQIREQLLIDGRLAVAGGGAAGPTMASTTPPPNHATMVDYPTNTCTCLRQLTDDLQWLCLEHRHVFVEDLRRKFDTMKNRNKAWLTSIARNPFNYAQLRNASDGRKAQRANNRKGRACRCGAEVVDIPQMRIVQCMTCQGIRLLDGTNPVPLPQVRTRTHLMNGANNRFAFRFRRAVNQGPAIGADLDNIGAMANGVR